MNAPAFRYIEEPPDWETHERPVLPGSPARLQHTLPRRLAYIMVGLFVGLVGGLGNGLDRVLRQAVLHQPGGMGELREGLRGIEGERFGMP